MRLVLAVCLLTVALSARAANLATSDVSTEAPTKNWNALLDVNHQPAMRKDQFTYTDITAYVDYRLDANNTFRVLQGPTKRYDLAPGQNEFVASETIISHYWNTPWAIQWNDINSTKLRWVTAVYLPTSIESQDNDKITALNGTLQFNTRFLGEKALLSIRPYARYNWYEFKTTKGGYLLPTLIYGITGVGSYDFTRKWSLSVTASYNEIQQTASQFDSSTNGIFEENAEGRYVLEASINYAVTSKFGIYGGYAAGDAYIKDGRYEVYAYDPKTTRLSLGASYFF